MHETFSVMHDVKPLLTFLSLLRRNHHTSLPHPVTSLATPPRASEAVRLLQPNAPQPITLLRPFILGGLLPVEMANKSVPWVLPEPVPVLTGNPRIDWVWVWVWGIPDFFNWVWGWGWG